MAPNPRRIDARLQELYDQLPTIECQGLCGDSCGPIDLSVRERARMEKAAGHPLGCQGISCNMLVEGKCSVYELRPMICRVWGVAESLPCPYGCKPDPDYISDYEVAVLIAESLKIGGGMSHSDRELYRLLKAAQEEFGQEGFADAVRAAFAHGVERPSLQGRSTRSPLEATPVTSPRDFRAGPDGVSSPRRVPE